MNNSYEELMNAKPLIPLTKGYNETIQRGTLIGFKGISNVNRITAAYPVYQVIGNEIQFELYKSRHGNSVIDNTFFGNTDLYINVEPIIVSVDMKKPSNWHQEIAKHFNF